LGVPVARFLPGMFRH